MAQPTEPTETIETAAPAPTRGGPGALRALRERDFRIFWVGLLVSATGSWMQNIAQGWLVYYLTHSPLWLGIIGFCGSLPMLVFTLPAGVVADRLRRRNVVMVTQTCAMLQAAAFGLLSYLGVIKPWHIAALAFSLGMVNSFDMPTRQAMVMELVPRREDLLSALALQSSAFNVARLIGPAVGGVLIALIYELNHSYMRAVGACFLINAATFLVLIFGLALIPARPPGMGKSTSSVWTDVKAGVRYVRRSPVMLTLMLMTGVSSLLGMPYAVMMPAFAQDVLKVGPVGLGRLVSSAGVGALAVAVVLSLWGHRWRRGRLATIGAFVFPVGLMAFALSRNFALSVACLALTGAGMMCFNVVTNTMMQTTPPPSMRGRVMGVRSFVFSGLAPMGNLEIGAMAKWFGPPVAVLAGGIACMLFAIGVFFRVPGLRRRR